MRVCRYVGMVVIGGVVCNDAFTVHRVTHSSIVWCVARVPAAETKWCGRSGNLKSSVASVRTIVMLRVYLVTAFGLPIHSMLAMLAGAAPLLNKTMSAAIGAVQGTGIWCCT